MHHEAAGHGVVVGLFGDPEVAQSAVNALARAGLPTGAISVVARDEVYEREMPEATGGGRPAGGHGQCDGRPPPAEAARRAGVDARSVQGMGSVLSAGPLLGHTDAARTGVVPDERADALIGRLVARGIAAADAAACAAHVAAGGLLVAAEAPPGLAAAAEEALREAGAERTVTGTAG